VLGGRPGPALDACCLDRWTAVAVALHDADAEVEALVPALRSDAFYVGTMGSRSRLLGRQACLHAAGSSDEAIGRLRAPIGLALGGREPREVALAVAAEILRDARGPSNHDSAEPALAAALGPPPLRPRTGATRRLAS
jgi:xanthine dehydrogenase accessory factor